MSNQSPTQKDYLTTNRESWNRRTDVHIESEFYDNKSFIAGRNSLNEIELPLLGDVNGKTLLHLQCHFGQDTISCSRMGAKATGIDLSDRSIEEAQKLAQVCGTDTRFLRSDVYDLPNQLHEKFDMVFTSYGTIGWLPDINRWAAVVNHFLKPGGSFVFAEFHPFIWSFDDDFNGIAYDYFNSDAIEETEENSYTDSKEKVETENTSWNHGLGEVISALLNQGLQIKHFSEYDYSPYNCFRHTIEFEPGKFRIEKFKKRVPMVYALRAVKAPQ